MFKTNGLDALKVGKTVEILAALVWLGVFIQISLNQTWPRIGGIYLFMCFATLCAFQIHTTPVIKMAMEISNHKNILSSGFALLEGQANLRYVENIFGYLGAIVSSVAMLHTFIEIPFLEFGTTVMWVISIGFTIFLSINVVRCLLKDSRFLKMELVMQPCMGIVNFIWIAALSEWIFM